MKGHKTFRRNFRFLSFVCACQMPRPLASHVYIFQWWEDTTFTGTSDSGRKQPGCRSVRRTCQPLHAVQVWACRIAQLASTCHTHFASFNASQFSQPRYCCRAKGCRPEFTGVWKVVWRLEVPVECHRFITASTHLMLLKFQTVNFLQFLFSYLEASHEMYENLHHSKISRYTILSFLHHILPPPLPHSLDPPLTHSPSSPSIFFLLFSTPLFTWDSG